VTTNRKQAEAEESMGKAAWDWWQGMEMGVNVDVTLTIERSKQKGVYALTLVAKDTVEDAANPIACRVVNTWPNSSQQTLAGLIFAMVMKLDRMVDEHALDRLNGERARTW
jgi:streptomycin 6-kinase